MNSNLPDGVTERMIPGNSRRDEFLQNKMEQIEGELDVLPGWLQDAITKGGDFSQITERCNWLYEKLKEDGTRTIGALEEARNLAQMADEGHEPEPEYEKEDGDDQ